MLKDHLKDQSRLSPSTILVAPSPKVAGRPVFFKSNHSWIFADMETRCAIESSAKLRSRDASSRHIAIFPIVRYLCTRILDLHERYYYTYRERFRSFSDLEIDIFKDIFRNAI